MIGGQEVHWHWRGKESRETEGAERNLQGGRQEGDVTPRAVRLQDVVHAIHYVHDGCAGGLGICGHCAHQGRFRQAAEHLAGVSFRLQAH